MARPADRGGDAVVDQKWPDWTKLWPPAVYVTVKVSPVAGWVVPVSSKPVARRVLGDRAHQKNSVAHGNAPAVAAK